MTQNQRAQLTAALGIILGAVLSIAMLFGVDLGDTPTPDVPTAELRTQPPFTQGPQSCTILVGQNYMSGQPEEVSYVPVYAQIEDAKVGRVAVWLQPGTTAHVAEVFAVHDNIWARIVEPQTGYVASQVGFYILDYPDCAALLDAIPAVTPILTPTTSASLTPIHVPCAVANVGPYPYNIREHPYIGAILVGELRPSGEVDVLGGSRNAWLELADGNYMAGWLVNLQYSASCEGVIN